MQSNESQVIILDADDTVFLLSEPLALTYQRILAEHGYSCLREQISFHAPIVWNEMRRVYLAQNNLRPINPTSEKAFWYEFIKVLCFSACNQNISDECTAAIHQHYATRSSRVLREGAQEFLEFLSFHEIRCALITNNDMRIHKLVEDFEMNKLFSLVISAAEIGHKKPSQSFFATIEEILQAQGEDIFYIGNDLELDILPSLERGWQSVWLRDGDPLRASAAPSVCSFHELLELFDEQSQPED